MLINAQKIQVRLAELRQEHAHAMLMKEVEPGTDVSHYFGQIQGHYKGITAALDEVNALVDEERERDRNL